MSAALTTNVDQRQLRTTKFPPEFNRKVDMSKVNKYLIKSWAQTEIARILNSDDDFVAELISNKLDESRYPNIKDIQIYVTGFLQKDAAPFCLNLWKLCLSAQENESGIPKELIEAKKAELTQEKEEKEKAREQTVKREEAERERERETTRIRQRERSDRARDRNDRHGRDFDRPPLRDSRSPPRRRRDQDDYRRAPPRADIYIPSDSGRRRRRSPSYDRASSRSRSPAPRRRRRNSSSSPSPSPRSRKRRNTSNDRSMSRDRRQVTTKKSRNNGRDRRRSRSPYSSRRSRSPERNRRRRSRSPTPKRKRRASSSPNRMDTSEPAHSQTPPTRRNKTPELASDDLMATKRQKQLPDGLRLSRKTTSPSLSHSESSLADDAKNQTHKPGEEINIESQDQPKDRNSVEAGAENEEEV